MTTIERLPKESTKAHAAFIEYAKLGPQRSLARVAQKLHKSRQLCGRWSRTFNWRKRAALWDARENRRDIEAEDKAKDSIALSAAQQQKRVQKHAWDWFEKLCAKAEEMLRFPLERQTVTERHPEGLEKPVVMEPIRWRFSDLAKLVELADTLGRLASGLPSRVRGISDPGGKPFTMPQATGKLPPIIFKFADDEDTRRAVAEFGAGGGQDCR